MASSHKQDKQVPSHVGLILDGNRRWAKSEGLPTLEGHKKGYNNLIDRADFLIERGVEYVSAYVFSTENWNRSEREVSYLMDLAMFVATKEVKRLNEKDIRVVWLGREEKLSPKLIKAFKAAEQDTKDNSRGTLVLCMNYGGHMEISDALKKIIKLEIKPEDITPNLVRENLYKPEVPDLDLVIRTSGEMRISNFMLWRLAYSELAFVDKHWPEMTDEDLSEILNDYKGRQRRFGA